MNCLETLLKRHGGAYVYIPFQVHLPTPQALSKRTLARYCFDTASRVHHIFSGARTWSEGILGVNIRFHGTRFPLVCRLLEKKRRYPVGFTTRRRAQLSSMMASTTPFVSKEKGQDQYGINGVDARTNSRFVNAFKLS